MCIYNFRFRTHPDILRDMKNYFHIILTPHSTKKNSLSIARPSLCPLHELSSQRGLIVNLIQFKCTKYFRDDLTFLLEDAQCFNSISEPPDEKLTN